MLIALRAPHKQCTTKMNHMILRFLLNIAVVTLSVNAFAPSTNQQKSVPFSTAGGRSSTRCDLFSRAGLWTAAAVAGCLSSINIVQQGNTAIVERLGKFKARLEPGLHFIIPIVDRVATSMTQREQVFDIPPQKCSNWKFPP